ncbi:EAL domain-containing protein [Chromobacterium haemolyticum]|uniref:EAL domain-containing protein n=1 Tax=Chromobacterium haemolyticum TaxID=394935 RepID=UPI00244C0F9A|nr:EAL domain-containing protein [Chromobacterium haemolyticum]MDH0342038.1 EAL domain-containing protein [Chromobacterium haemolyticum]
MHKVVVPVFQPIVEIETGGVSHYEALARAREGSAGHVRLIELGEHYGFIDLIDMAMMEKVFRLLHDQPNAVLAVNVSVGTIEQSCSDVLSLVFKNMDLVRRLVFEITETVEIRDMGRISRFVQAVRLLNARVAIDDFGAGFFTLPLVREIQPEFLKLSCNLVADMNRTADEILRLKEQIRGYGGEIIAEHVDSHEKLNTLRRLGVRYAQGYLLGVPTPMLAVRPQLEVVSGAAVRAVGSR